MAFKWMKDALKVLCSLKEELMKVRDTQDQMDYEEGDKPTKKFTIDPC